MTTAKYFRTCNMPYDSLGQVISGKKYWPDGTPVAGQQFEYTFDDIGNRKETKAGGDAAGGNLRGANSTNNLLNQITGRDVPGTNDIIGIAHASATVTVNGQSTYRKGEYYQTGLSVRNRDFALYPYVTNTAVLAGVPNAATGRVFVARSPETFVYDADGNLTQDGRCNYTWDAENRLTRMLSRSDTPTSSWLSLTFAYDPQGRRISKVVSNWTGTAWALSRDQRFIYDGWNLIAILNSSSSLLTSFTWGLDVSASLHGAGGVGGLLCLNNATNGAHFTVFDGNGNVMALANATNGTVSAKYEYGPFGEVIRATGPMASADPFRFSTKYQDDETDLLYYGFRYYNPNTGRWINIDPIGEHGGANLFCFVHNSPGVFTDSLGTYINVPPGGNSSDPWPYDCDPCKTGPFFGTETETLRAYRWHIFGKTWAQNTIQLYIPNTTIPITAPFHLPLSGGYWVISGGWIGVYATCKKPDNRGVLFGWILADFIVSEWPRFVSLDLKPTVMCKYTCGKKVQYFLGVGATKGLPPIQRDPGRPGSPPPTFPN
jgi:RHS repeat-associated protein